MDFRVTYLKTLLILILSMNTFYCFSQDQISKIKFVYTKTGIVNAVATSCTVESFNEFYYLDTKTVKDRSYLNEFANKFSKLVPDSSVYVIDARIMTIISYSNTEKKDTLCFGEYHGTDLNGTFMKDNPDLLNLVKKIVWR